MTKVEKFFYWLNQSLIQNYTAHRVSWSGKMKIVRTSSSARMKVLDQVKLLPSDQVHLTAALPAHQQS